MANKLPLLVDTLAFKVTTLEESRNNPGMYVARGEFARSDVATANKRLYPHKVWENEIRRLNKALKEKKIYGHSSHPADGRTDLDKVSHIVTDLRMEGDSLFGTAIILDTASGKNLKAIFDGGGSLGVSSRGFGTTKPNLKGEEVVQEDYRLMTFDFVSEPAQQTAYPVINVEHEDTSANASVIESNTTSSKEEPMDPKMTLEDFKKKYPELAEHFVTDAEKAYEKKAAKIWADKIMAAKSEASTNLRDEFAEKLDQAVADAKAEMEKSVTEKLMKDPTVAAAKQTMDELKTLLRPFIVTSDVETVVADKDGEIGKLESKVADLHLEIANLKTENDKLAQIAKKAGYLFHLEQRINQLGHADEIRKAVGSVSDYASISEMDEQIATTVNAIELREAAELEVSKKIAHLEEQIATQKAITEKALEASRHLATQVYVEQRLVNHPNAKVARSLIEAHEPDSKEAVDQLVAKTLPMTSMSEDIEGARMRVRKLLNSNTFEYLPESVDGSKGGTNSGAARDYNGLGVDVGQIRALAGMPGKGN